MRDFAGGNQKRFAELLDLQQSQISQMVGIKKEVSDKMWLKILNTLNVKDIATQEDFDNLQQELEMARNTIHQGRQLEEYMAKHNIKGVDVAKKLGVTPAMVSLYKASEQFRPEVAEKINALVSLNEDPVLYGPNRPSNAFEQLPLIGDTARNLQDLSKCPRYQITAQTDYNLDGAVVIKVESDAMEPVLRKESELLAVAVSPHKYKYHTGLTAVHYADMVAIGDVQSNDILDKGYITLHRGKGSVLRVLSEDIQHLWHIVLGLNVKF